ncbi:FAD-binding domain-containing protein [Imleria badia]|nr:FAD-binding domain-containing protein [Imleria badia]
MIRAAFLYMRRTNWQYGRHSFQETCQEIAASISNASGVHDVCSSVHIPFMFKLGLQDGNDVAVSLNYLEDISHWASSSTQIAACSFEPGTVADVGIALRILNQTRTPFAVKGGGRATNPGFSSTTGVQIAMSRFSEIVYHSEAQTVEIGAGLVWDDVYAALEPHGVNVVGGRISGYGLVVDTVQTFELVMPNGTAINVTETSSPDLFFALKGGMNNFGIVTRFTLKTFPQTEVWGGLITYTADVLDRVNIATANFAASNSDPKAAIVTGYIYALGELVVAEALFYDAPTTPTGIFDEFLAIPSLTKDVGPRSYLSFVRSIPQNDISGIRGAFNTISATKYPLSFLQSIINETLYWGEHLALECTALVNYNVEVFLPTHLSHNTTPTAYPPSRAHGFMPLEIYFAWLSPDSDQCNYDAVRRSARTLQASANSVGDITNPALYPNYAIFDTPLVDLYGANLPRLQAIKAAVDPDHVMNLAGGFKL